MGLLSWLIEEVVEAFTDDAPDHADHITGAAADGLLPGGGSGLDFVDPLEQGRQVIAADPVLSGVQNTMSEASATYREAMGTDHVPTGPESTQQLISDAQNASPEQLDRMSTQLEGMNAEADIRQSVSEHEAALRESNATHQAIIDANAVDIEAQGRIDQAESLIARTNQDLGTAY